MSYFVTLGIILFLYMNFWFVVSLLMKRNDVADVAWGLGFVLLAWVSLFISETNSILGIIVTLFVTVWGLRLAWHVHSRNKGKTEIIDTLRGASSGVNGFICVRMHKCICYKAHSFFL